MAPSRTVSVLIALTLRAAYLLPVKLSVKSDYAARALLALARHHPRGQAQRVESLAEGQGIPANYLVQILIELKSQHLVKSLRGKEGGYLLAKAPSEITLGDVLRSIHGQVFESPALADPHCPTELRQAWSQIREAVTSTADKITFQQLLDAGDKQSRMYYI